ncbi:MAG: amidohydrolase [Kiritimatiellia bacterium]
MYDYLIRNTLLKGNRVDIAIKGKKFVAIEPAGTLHSQASSKIIEGTRFLARSPFYNTHTHQAMTLLRGIDDECTLMDWLKRCIWPREIRLTPELVEIGTQLAILEGIHSGCVAFNDMYFHQPATIRAAIKMGVRAQIGLVMMDQVSDHIENETTLEMRAELPETIHLAFAPHALYTTTPEILRDVARQAERLRLPIHMHASESLAEVETARTRFNKTPIAYLDSCGLLNETTILAHACHLTDADIEILSQRQCILAHCPQSNQKLASGIFPYVRVIQAGLRMTVGTDGAASNNGLSMISESKAAALSAKCSSGAPEIVKFTTLDRAVTEVAANALGFPHAGRITVGSDADLLLVNMDRTFFAGGGDPDNNFIYASDSSCVDTVFCNGRLLMQASSVEGEAEILSAARKASEVLRSTYASANKKASS